MRHRGRGLHARRILTLAVLVLGVLAMASAPAAADDCPAMPPNHIPDAPPPPLNIDLVKRALLDYHGQFYNLDVAAVFEAARNYVESYAGDAKLPAIVLDIDETSLTNWPNLVADNFGFISGGSCDALPAGPCGFNAWIALAKAEALRPALKLFKAAKARRIAVIFITGRHDRLRDATLINLDHAGFDGWTELHTRPDSDEFATVQAYKTAERIKVEAEGYTIIANVGDQMSDINGEHARCTFKVPNPFYFIP
ncbi:MAG TPA: HAD family acid phosphatase [Bradyrhizobium sp.]|nr:HAD family acid phosphatase [Bradyrhizobium sp.]